MSHGFTTIGSRRSHRFMAPRTVKAPTDDATPAPTSAPVGVEGALGAAVVGLCHALMNVNEFLYVD